MKCILRTIRSISLMLVSFIASTIIFNSIQDYKDTKEWNQNIEKMNKSISPITRGGYVKYNQSGMSDSVKVK